MSMGKEKTIPIIAMIVLSIGILSTIYVDANQIEKETITINGQDFTLDQLFSSNNIQTIYTDEGEKTGVALDEILIIAGIGCIECNEYTIKAKDGYQQTLSWNIFKTGILTDYKTVFFPDTAHSFWVRDVIEIEVN